MLETSIYIEMAANAGKLEKINAAFEIEGATTSYMASFTTSFTLDVS